MSTATMDREAGTKQGLTSRCAWCGMGCRRTTCSDHCRDRFSEFLKRTLSESKALSSALVKDGLIEKDAHRKAADVLAEALNESFHWHRVHRQAAR